MALLLDRLIRFLDATSVFTFSRCPGISALLSALVALTAVSLAATAVIYGLRGELVLPPRKTTAGPGATRHLAVLLALLFVLFAVRLWIVGSSELLYSTTGPLMGASYTDVHVRLPAIRLSAIVAMLAAATILYGAARRQLIWYSFISTLLYVVVGVVFRGVAPAMVQKFGVAPNELSRERPYIAQHIAATRRAWRIDSVQTHALEGDVQLTMADIKSNAPTIDNVRLWERDLLKQTFGQLQEIRTYYDFFSVNDDRYMIDGRYRQVHLSARELNTSSLPTQKFHQRPPDLHTRHGRDHGARKSGDVGGAAGAVHQGCTPGFDCIRESHTPADLLWRDDEQLRVRGYEPERVRLPGR